MGGLWRGELTFTRAARLTVNLPSGCETWIATGGAKAWSEEVAALNRHVTYLSQLILWLQTEDAEKGKNQPEPMEYPPFFADEENKADKNDRRAELFAKQQQRIAVAAAQKEE